MKKLLLILPLLAPLLLTSCSLSIQTSRRSAFCSDAYPTTVETGCATGEDFETRLKAARRMDSFMSRDEAYAGIALDAAKAGNVEAAKQAVDGITSFMTRDDAAAGASRSFLKQGMRSEAFEVAQKITSFMTRDEVLREIAR